MRVTEIWRYPVKSLQGEKLTQAVVDVSGVRGDRCWGIHDETTGKILTGRREPDLLLAVASCADDGEPDIVLPSGDVCSRRRTKDRRRVVRVAPPLRDARRCERRAGWRGRVFC